MIINKELGLDFNENPWQRSYVVEPITDLGKRRKRGREEGDGGN